MVDVNKAFEEAEANKKMVEEITSIPAPAVKPSVDARLDAVQEGFAKLKESTKKLAEESKAKQCIIDGDVAKQPVLAAERAASAQAQKSISEMFQSMGVDMNEAIDRLAKKAADDIVEVLTPVRDWKWWGKRIGIVVAVLYALLISATCVVPDGNYTYKGSSFKPTGMEHTLQTSKWFGLSHDTYKGNVVTGWKKQ